MRVTFKFHEIDFDAEMRALGFVATARDKDGEFLAQSRRYMPFPKAWGRSFNTRFREALYGARWVRSDVRSKVAASRHDEI